MNRSCALATIALLSAIASTSFAEPHVDKKNYFQIDLATGWNLAEHGAADDAERILLSASNPKGGQAVLIRASYPNRPAWRNQKTFFDDVASGLKRATDGFVLVAKKRGKIGRVPILDIRYRRADKAQPHVAVRFVFFRTFTLILSVTSTRALRGGAAALARSLTPVL